MSRLPTLAVVVVLISPLHARAQSGVGDFTNLPIRPGDTVYVRLSDGAEIGGAISKLSPSMLQIGTHEVQWDTVLQVDRRGDSLTSGAVIGAAVLGGLCALSCGFSLESGEYAAAIAINAGFGALIGVLFDMAHAGRTTIFRAPPEHVVRLTPVMDPVRHTLGLALSF